MIRGIILAGGTGSRLGPLSKVTNKHLLPVGLVPMIYHPLSQLLCNNIKDICIVSGLFHLGSVVSLLGSGKRFGCEFTYKVQDEAGGIAEALNLCKNFANNKPIMVFLGDNIFGKVLSPNINNNIDGIFYIKSVPNPQHFGVAEVDHLKKLIDIEEKPENPKSNMAVTGAYVYSSKIWTAINSIKRSSRGELEISDANKWLINHGTIITHEIKEWWSDAGSPDSYKLANQMVLNNLEQRLINKLNEMIRC
jgi:glucose-1-phosphate thymidylyltransferase